MGFALLFTWLTRARAAQSGRLSSGSPSIPLSPRGLTLSLALLLGACSTPTDISPTHKAWQASLWQELPGWENNDPGPSWAALQRSCTVLKNRPAWKNWCLALPQQAPLSAAEQRRFLERTLRPWQLQNRDGSRTGLITGYYEPEFPAQLERSDAYPIPLYGPPKDLIRVDLSSLYPQLKTMRLRGRLEQGVLKPYPSRADIMRDGIDAPILAWLRNPMDLLILQVQGSGRLQLPNGNTLRVGYADQNGHPYQAIGQWLIAQKQLQAHQVNMPAIQAWAEQHPEQQDNLLNSNPSFVFFKEIKELNNRSDQGPIGAMGLALSPEVSLAVDPASTPLGSPVWLSGDIQGNTWQKLMVAQDTGGAIKGVVRADLYWGTGAQAGQRAGTTKASAAMWLLLPQGVEPETLLKNSAGTGG